MPQKQVIVVGGGLAGMATAVALESAGIPVTVLEAGNRLGGRASSFQDPATSEILDNCQHVLLGCCTNLLDFYRRLGSLHLIQFERTIFFRNSTGKRFDLFGLPGLPAPLNLGLSFLLFSGLTFSERIAYARGMLAMLRMGRFGRAKLSETSFGQWLDDHHQPASLVAKMYDAVLVGALNEQSRPSSAVYAVQVFQDAMLANAAGYVLGLPACPLSELYARLPCKDVRLGTRVASLQFAENHVTGVTLTDGQVLPADAVVLATNHHAVLRWIPTDWLQRDRRFAGLDQLQSVPILGVHLWFDRPVMTESHAALFTGPLQWLFRKDTQGRALHGVISAARDWVGKDKDECLKLFEQQIQSVLPLARNAKLERGVIVIEKRATFAPTPGVDNLRPMQAADENGITNLFLAGDYTRTGWPATMEGAVRGGYLAAQAVLQSFGISAQFLVPDLPIQWPARLLGLGN